MHRTPFVARRLLGALLAAFVVAATALTALALPATQAGAVGAPAKLAFTVQPVTTVAGAVMATAPVVQVRDSSNDNLADPGVTVTLTVSAPGTFDPSATISEVTDANGQATFSNLALDTVASSLKLTAAATGLTSSVSGGFNITPSTATQLSFTQAPVDGLAGAVQSPVIVVKALDAYGNVATGATGTVTLTSNPAATLTNPTRALVSGAANFGSFAIPTVGTYTLTASLGSLTPATSGAFNITPNAPYQLVWSTQPSAITAGQVMSPSPTVLIEDHYGNVETSDSTDTVSLATGGGFDPSSTTTVTASNGVATFSNVSLDDVGNVNHTIVASSPTTTTLKTATSAQFAVSPGAPYSLAIVQPQLGGQVNTGNSIGTFYLEQYDQYGNNTWGPGPEGTPLTFSSSSPGGTFSLTDDGPSTTTGNFVYPPNDNNPPNNRYTYFYYGDTQVGLPTITVSSPGLISATQQVEIINVESPGDQSDPLGAAITPIQMTGQNSSPDYSFTSWSATGLPDGISIDPSSGIISGAPTTAGVYSVEVYGYEGTYAYGYTSFTWTIGNTVSVTNPGDQSSSVGTAITPVTVTAADSDPSATLTYSDGGTLPTGLSIDPTSGTISGTPTQSGVYSVTVTATDGDGASGSTTFTWTVVGATITHLSKTTGATGGGTRVAIKGTGLSGATEVKFGSVDGTITHVNKKGTKLKVIAPAHAAGTVDVTVVTPQGPTLPSAADQFTYQGPAVTGISPSSGPAAGGTRVKISGSQLNSATQVLFGSTPGTIVSANGSGTSLVVQSPAGTGTVDVTVVTPGGTTAVVPADQFTYLGPVVTGLRPATGPAAGGTKVKVSGTNLDGATQVLFGSTPGTAVSVNGAGTQVTVTAPAGTGTVDVTVTTPSGPSAVVPADQYTYG